VTVNNSPALPSVAVVIHSVLDKSDGAIAQARLIPMVSPPSLGNETHVDGDPKRIPDTLKLLQDFGALAQSEDGWQLTAKLKDTSVAGPTHGPLARHLRRAFLSPVHAGDSEAALWASDQGSRDFCRSAAWFLMQDIWRGPWKFPGMSGVEHEQGRQMTADPNRKQPLFNTSTRWDGFSRWAVFTGLARLDAIGLLPDPTHALVDELQFHELDKPAPVREFMDFISTRLPVLDNGAYHNWVRARRTVTDQRARDNSLSPALTHSLHRLQAQGRLKLEDRADAPDKVVLASAPDRAHRVVVSHVTVLPS
jgi:hypothetical protein